MWHKNMLVCVAWMYQRHFCLSKVSEQPLRFTKSCMTFQTTVEEPEISGFSHHDLALFIPVSCSVVVFSSVLLEYH